jgi:hypothetical protein
VIAGGGEQGGNQAHLPLSPTEERAVRERSDEQIGAYWDLYIRPYLVASGTPEDGLTHLRARYLTDVRASPEALRQIAELRDTGWLDRTEARDARTQ